jgi:hypothetical protein
MAPYQISITKDVTWRGTKEEFSNVYHYDIDFPPTATGWDDLINAIVVEEKKAHSSAVTYLRARVNGPTDQGDIADVTQHLKDLSGAGTMSGAGTTMAPELTMYASIYMGRSARGYKTYLRKYYHTQKLFSSGTATDATAVTPLGSADKNALITILNALKTVTVGASTNNLCKPNGQHIPAGGTWVVGDFVHTRQFRN